MFDFNYTRLSERKEEKNKNLEDYKKVSEKLKAHYENVFNKYGYDNLNTDLFDQLIKFCGYYYKNANKKGLFLCAKNGEVNTGIGKTYGMSLIYDLFEINMFSATNYTVAYLRSKDLFEDLLSTINGNSNSIKQSDIIIDEVGAENTANDYGNKLEVFTVVLEDRYKKFINSGIQTHFNSNLTKEEIASRYGHRVWSRINEMCNVIEVSGIDRRFE